MKTFVFTIGHSTRTEKEFLDLLKANSIEILADVRTIPKSRYVPQFNGENISKALEKEKVSYTHMAGLGGLRHARQDSPNTGWRNASFRGFADYMQTDEFQKSINKLVGIAKKHTTAIMCAESVPWRCHRSLIADALVVRGFDVFHIMGPGKLRRHELTKFATVKGQEVSYPKQSLIKDSLITGKTQK